MVLYIHIVLLLKVICRSERRCVSLYKVNGTLASCRFWVSYLGPVVIVYIWRNMTIMLMWRHLVSLLSPVSNYLIAYRVEKILVLK